jgi:hypothetical protein
LPSIEDNYSIDHFAYRAFSATVRTNQCHHFPGAYIQVPIGKGDDTTVVLDNVASGKRLNHGDLFEILLYFGVGHDVIQQVGIRFAFTHCQAFVQVVGFDDGRQRDDKG